MVSCDPIVEIASEISGRTTVHVYGQADAVTGERALWSRAEPFGLIDRAEPVRIRAGGHTDDSADGSGARSVRLYGLGQDKSPAMTSLYTRGEAESAPSITPMYRVHSARVVDAGESRTNTWPIEIETTSGALLAVIPTGRSQTAQAIFSIPRACIGTIDEVFAAVSGPQPVTLRMIAQADGVEREIFRVSTSRAGLIFRGRIVLDELTDVCLTVQSAAPASVSASFEITVDRRPII